MRRGRVLVLVALLVLGLALAGYLFLTLGSDGDGEVVEPAVTPEVRDANIVIAAQDIPRGAVIPADGVIISPFPSDMLVTGDGGMLTDIGQVVGRRARMEIARGVPITANMLTEQAGDLLGVGSDAAIAIEPGFTAISIPMSRLSSVAYAIRAGDEVDVLASLLVVDLDAEFQSLLPDKSVILVGIDRPLTGQVCDMVDPGTGACILTAGPLPLGRSETDVSTGELLYLNPSEKQRPRLVTQRLIEKATVLNVGTFPLQDEVYQPTYVSPEEGGQPVEQTTITPVVKPPDIITLIVRPQEALALNYAIKAGIDLVFTLRGPDDFSQTETSSVSLEYLFNNYNITIPSKPAYGLQPRLDEIISPVLPNDGSSAPAQ
jgi:Flp pilus assembly protein CpaB